MKEYLTDEEFDRMLGKLLFVREYLESYGWEGSWCGERMVWSHHCIRNPKNLYTIQALHYTGLLVDSMVPVERRGLPRGPGPDLRNHGISIADLQYPKDEHFLEGKWKWVPTSKFLSPATSEVLEVSPNE